MKDYLKFEVDTKSHDLISVIDELPIWSAPFGMKLLDTIKLKKNIKALDLGCGLGFPLIELAGRLGQTSQVYGIDPWEEALERVRFKLRVYDIKNVIVVNGFAEDMPFENEYFNLIVSNNGINNVKDLAQTLKECFRVCKANAQMVFNLNTKETMNEFYLVFKEVLKEKYLHDEIRKMNAQIYEKRKPLEEIKKLTKESGFTIKNIIHDSFKLRFLDGTTMLNHYLIKYWFLDGWKKILNKNNLVSVFDRIESKMNEQGEEKTEMSLTIPFVTFDCRRN